MGGDCGFEGGTGLAEGGVLDVADVVFRFTPHVFDGVVVGCVGRECDQADVGEFLAGSEFVTDDMGFVGRGVVPDDGDLLAGMVGDERGEGVEDEWPVLPGEPDDLAGAGVLVEEPDVVLAFPFPVDQQFRLGAFRVPGPAHDGFLVDADLVGGVDQGVGVGQVGGDLVADLVDPGLDHGVVGAAPVERLGLVERQSGHAEQEVVGGC